MSRLHGMRKLFAEVPGSAGGRFRARRWEWFSQTFPEIEKMSVLDLGGTAQSWQYGPVQPGHVHLVNLGEPKPDLPSWITAEVGDACGPLTGSYDLVFSNSVIEHVGGHLKRQEFADNVHRLAPRHWVQAPYRYFPLEPHWLFPGFQFLPVTTRAFIARRWSLGMMPKEDRRRQINVILKTELPSKTEMKYYFPDSKLRTETFLGMPKSLIAIKQ